MNRPEDDQAESVETWGQRFLRQARQLALRHLPPAGPAQRGEEVWRRWARSLARAEQHRGRVEVVPRSEGAAAFDPRQEGHPLSTGHPLPPEVRDHLHAALGAAPPIELRVHSGPAADHLARQHQADAVAVGDDIFFREGRHRPNEPQGFGLLAHEAAHALVSRRPELAARRSLPRGSAVEERFARRVERSALGLPLASPPARTPRFDSIPPAAGATPAARPMPADTGRSLDEAPAPSIDVDELRGAVYADLMTRLRTDYERGG